MADQRVNATISNSEATMKQYQKKYEFKIYDGADHTYMRYGDDLNGHPENILARNPSW